jgi:probable F420-dependent oxidoreductase
MSSGSSAVRTNECIVVGAGKTVERMKIDGGIGFDPSGIAEAAQRAEATGYDGVWSAETGHDPFLPIAIGAAATETLEFGTGIAVAFARNPMNLAVLANDLQQLSKGRFILGLGSQIKPHITKRFSMPWSHPAPRMRELILAIRAIWECWDSGEKLNFRGEFYTHTLMTPFFNPGQNPYGNPKVLLAAVGTLMTEVAGEAGDGLLVHGFTTEQYLREVSLPALERGAAKAGKTRADLTVSYPGFIVTGATEADTAAADTAVRRQIAFYGSTPAYRPVLELHGWGDLQTELNTLSKRGEWVQMGQLIDDEMLEAFAVVCPIDQVATQVKARFGGLVDRFSFYAPYKMSPEDWQSVLAGFHSD